MAESRARRRIRKAVELYGYRLDSLEWEPVGLGAEMEGPSGGWRGEITFPDGRSPDMNAGEGECYVLGYSVDHVLDWIDLFVRPVDPCGCPQSDYVARQRAQIQTHGPECRYHLTYSLPWFKERAS